MVLDMKALTQIKLFPLYFFVLLLIGCETVYYGTLEKFGIEKRDILVDRVGDARDAQQEAKQQFESSLEQFIAVTNFSGGDLEKQYRRLKAEFDDSEAKANEVHDRIASLERVSEDLFAEWREELGQYTNQDLRRSSQRQLKDTQASYTRLIKAMKSAERKMKPVLAALRDRVLFLKHNLNARAIASLKSDRDVIKTDVAALIRDMNKSIAEADRFIKAME
jgi:Skp family chaperone for outer membrane proteins